MMPSETHWTADQVKEYLEALMGERDRAVTAALAAADMATSKAESNAEKWRDNANEWRGQSADRERSQAEQIATLVATFLPRETFEAWKSNIEKSNSQQAGERAGSRTYRADALAIIAVLISLAVLILIIIHQTP